MNTLLINAAWGLAFITSLFVALWIASVVRHDASLVDRVWGAGFVVLAWFYWWLTGMPTISLFVLMLISIWGLRLSVYLTWRNWGHGEDYRYTQMREQYGTAFAWVSLVTVYLLQAVILWLVAFALLPTVSADAYPLTAWSLLAIIAGIALWALGVVFETVGDWQLARFKAISDNKGKVLASGLWRYTRHPNYFGEICVWWGFYCLALPVGGWWTVFAPALMTFLIIRVSGVALLEKGLSQKTDYDNYKARTSALVPWPPKNNT